MTHFNWGLKPLAFYATKNCRAFVFRTLVQCNEHGWHLCYFFLKVDHGISCHDLFLFFSWGLPGNDSDRTGVAGISRPEIWDWMFTTTSFCRCSWSRPFVYFPAISADYHHYVSHVFLLLFRLNLLVRYPLLLTYLPRCHDGCLIFLHEGFLVLFLLSYVEMSLHWLSIHFSITGVVSFQSFVDPYIFHLS